MMIAAERFDLIYADRIDIDLTSSSPSPITPSPRSSTWFRMSGRHAVRPRFALGGIPPDGRGDKGPGRRIPFLPLKLSGEPGNQFISARILSKCVSSSGSPGIILSLLVRAG